MRPALRSASYQPLRPMRGAELDRGTGSGLSSTVTPSCGVWASCLWSAGETGGEGVMDGTAGQFCGGVCCNRKTCAACAALP